MLTLDRAHFDHMTGADRALQTEVLGLFRMQAEGWSAAMASANGWREAVHTLKGSARGIGLNALAAACEAAETAEDSEAGLHDVRVALNEALSALEQFAAEAA
ncbi:MAG: Hpt domain-containing protein [Hyphomonadaceae bacterium]|jgi:HPt (histidine-containing phosphotransfer) domain-containing protein|nr:Hpt domain-containing protein [Hyphomonadaceae bacterium]